MKPILHIKLPEESTPKEWQKVYNGVKESTNNEYHILISNNVEIQILNGEELTELTFEQFKQQYIK